MIQVILLCCVMLGDGGKPTETPTATDRAAYEAAAAKTGKNAAAHVKLALWCEAHGMTAERIKHLSLAVSLAPANPLARGLLGQVAFQGKWAGPEQIEREIRSDPKLQALFREYLDRRIDTPQKDPDAQLRLAAWCLENGLKRRGDGSLQPRHPPRPFARYRLDSTRLQEVQGSLVQARRPGSAETRSRPPEASRQRSGNRKLQKLRDALEEHRPRPGD